MKLRNYRAFVSTMALFVAAPFAQALPIVSVAASAGQVTVGNTVTVDITITGAADLYGFQFDLGFASSIVAVSSPTEGAFLGSSGDTFFIAGTIGANSVTETANTLLTAISGVSGNGILASFTFTALNAGITELNLSQILLLDSALNLQEFVASNGQLTVVPPSDTNVPEPTSPVLLLFGLLLIGARSRMRRSVAARVAR